MGRKVKEGKGAARLSPTPPHYPAFYAERLRLWLIIASRAVGSFVLLSSNKKTKKKSLSISANRGRRKKGSSARFRFRSFARFRGCAGTLYSPGTKKKTRPRRNTCVRYFDDRPFVFNPSLRNLIRYVYAIIRPPCFILSVLVAFYFPPRIFGPAKVTDITRTHADFNFAFLIYD